MASTMTPRMPKVTNRRACPRRMVEPMVTAAAAAIIGVIRGAIIIAPMTAAVESVTTPYVAMTVASASRTMKFTICLFFLSPSKNSLLSKLGRYSGSNRFVRIFAMRSGIMVTSGKMLMPCHYSSRDFKKFSFQVDCVPGQASLRKGLRFFGVTGKQQQELQYPEGFPVQD